MATCFDSFNLFWHRYYFPSTRWLHLLVEIYSRKIGNIWNFYNLSYWFGFGQFICPILCFQFRFICSLWCFIWPMFRVRNLQFDSRDLQSVLIPSLGFSPFLVAFSLTMSVERGCREKNEPSKGIPTGRMLRESDCRFLKFELLWLVQGCYKCNSSKSFVINQLIWLIIPVRCFMTHIGWLMQNESYFMTLFL